MTSTGSTILFVVVAILTLSVAIIIPNSVRGAPLEVDIVRDAYDMTCTLGLEKPKDPRAVKQGAVCKRIPITCGDKPGVAIGVCKQNACVTVSACDKMLEGKPEAAKGIVPNSNGGGQNPSAPTPGATQLPPQVIDSSGKGGMGEDILPAFNEPSEGSFLPRADSGWTSQFLNLLSGLAGLFSPSSAPSSGSAPGGNPPPQYPPARPTVIYTPVYVGTPAPSPLARVEEISRFTVDSTFPYTTLTTFETPSLSTLAADTLFDLVNLSEPEITLFPINSVPMSGGEGVVPRVVARGVAQETPRARASEVSNMRPLIDAGQLTASNFEMLTEENPQPLLKGTQKDSNVKLESGGVGGGAEFPDALSIFASSLSALPPITSIVSVPSLSFEIARSGLAVMDILNDYVQGDIVTISPGVIASQGVQGASNDLQANSPFLFGGETSPRLTERFVSAARSAWTFLTRLFSWL